MSSAEKELEKLQNADESTGHNLNGNGGNPDLNSNENMNSEKINVSKSKKKNVSRSKKKNVSKSKNENVLKSEEKRRKNKAEILIGEDYQAIIPDFIPENERKPELLKDHSLLLWSPKNDIPENKLDEYISMAKEKYGHGVEQSLGILLWQRYDLVRAGLSLAHFKAFANKWSVEDKMMFEEAFLLHGKDFRRIEEMLPNKTIGNLVNYYYLWKKTCDYQSEMDRRVKAKKRGVHSENSSNDELDSKDKDQVPGPSTSQDFTQKQQTNDSQSLIGTSTNAFISDVASDVSKAEDESFNSIQLTPSSSVGCCVVCGVSSIRVNNSPRGKVCNRCYCNWGETGIKRSTFPVLDERFFSLSAERRKSKQPPRRKYKKC